MLVTSCEVRYARATIQVATILTVYNSGSKLIWEFPKIRDTLSWGPYIIITILLFRVPY